MEQFNEIFTQVFQKNGLDEYIQPAIMEKFAALTKRMVEVNAVMNITALTTEEKIIPLHYADCLKVAAYIPKNAHVLDVGCGGGFPILPLAIIRPDLHLTGLDSTEKKIRYVQSTADELGLRIQTIAGRAEDIAKLPAHRDGYDVVIGRAVARMNVLDELCIPFVKPNGRFIAMKGAAGAEEFEEAAPGIEKLGGIARDLLEYDLHLVDGCEKRTLLFVEKISRTPKEFPRAFGAIKKRPL